VVGEQITAKKPSQEDAKPVRLGKVLATTKNIGVAMIDITKLDELGTNTKYLLDDYEIALWQPSWLEVDGPSEDPSAENPEEKAEEPIIETTTAQKPPPSKRP